MRRILVALVASGLGMTLSTVAGAADTSAPPYQAGPRGGDNHSFAVADPSTGTVAIFEDNLRQAAAVACAGDGPRATLLATHTVSGLVSGVKVQYSDAMLSDNVVMDVLVTGSQSGWLGHKAAFGPKMNESGTVNVTLARLPLNGETLTTQFGLQVGPGCLPAQPVGLWGSRPVEGGRAIFSSIDLAGPRG
jgi:hypothetical protein